MNKETFKVGDHVKFRSGGGGMQSCWLVGNVKGVTKAGTLTISSHGQEIQFRRKNYGYQCTLLTAHEKSILTWLKNKPKLVLCQYKWSWNKDDLDPPTGITLDTIIDNLVTSSNELMAIAQWMAKKPIIKQNETPGLVVDLGVPLDEECCDEED